MRKTVLLLAAVLTVAGAAHGRGRRHAGPELSGRSGAELIGMLASHPDTKVRVAAAAALAERREPEAFPPLLARLEDAAAPQELRSQIAWSIHGFQDARATPALLRAMSEAGLRLAAMHSLGELKAKEAVEPIVDLLLKHIGHGPDTGDGIDHAAEIAEGTRALGAIGEVQGLRGLLPVIATQDPWRRAEAVDAVVAVCRRPEVPEDLRTELAVPMLTHLLDPEHEKSSDVRLRAAQGLAGFPDPRVVPALQKAFREDRAYRVRAAAADALNRIGAPGGPYGVFKDIDQRIQNGNWDGEVPDPD